MGKKGKVIDLEYDEEYKIWYDVVDIGGEYYVFEDLGLVIVY